MIEMKVYVTVKVPEDTDLEDAQSTVEEFIADALDLFGGDLTDAEWK
jgi:hypothetical protein